MNPDSLSSGRTRAHWEHFPHAADVGVRGFGSSAAEAFEQAALAMIAIVADPAGVRDQQCVDVECAAPDLELLLCDWLNALIYEMATRRLLFGAFRVNIAEGHLHGTVCGEPLDAARHQPNVELKGATFTELRVVQDAAGVWQAQCVVDV